MPAPTPGPPKRPLTDAEAAELARTVRTRRPWPRPPAAAFWFRIISDGCLLASLLTLITVNALTRPRTAAVTRPPSAWLLVPGLFVAWIVFRFLANRICWRLRRRVVRGGGLACINCHYPLSALDADDVSEHVCPECREPYRPAEVRKEWSNWQPGVWFY